MAQETGNVSIGEAFVGRLRAQCHKLASFEIAIGRARPELGPGIRGFPYKGYVIFFHYVDERFEVINILEGHRDVEAYFSEKDEP
ncbi:MAG: type II toxin-antitoxin system RelE/ParE family toxin [Methylocystis sp.]